MISKATPSDAVPCPFLALTAHSSFGRNFDWGACATLIVQTHPRGGYASISTVNMDFLNLGLNLSEDTSVRLMSAAAPYAPMDGMNAKGLCVAVLMIEDRPGFDQNTGKTDLTTTSAVRLLLDKAATVDEALETNFSCGTVRHSAVRCVLCSLRYLGAESKRSERGHSFTTT